MMLSMVLSLILGATGIVLWIEGGPHPRTAGAWLLLGAILIVSATPMRGGPSSSSALDHGQARLARLATFLGTEHERFLELISAASYQDRHVGTESTGDQLSHLVPGPAERGKRLRRRAGIGIAAVRRDMEIARAF